MTTFSVAATPFEYTFPAARTALVVIDMQRDFIEPGGFGASLGNDVRRLLPADRADRRAARRLAGARVAGRAHARGAPRRPLRLPAGQAPARHADPAHRRRRARWGGC